METYVWRERERMKEKVRKVTHLETWPTNQVVLISDNMTGGIYYKRKTFLKVLFSQVVLLLGVQQYTLHRLARRIGLLVQSEAIHWQDSNRDRKSVG